MLVDVYVDYLDKLFAFWLLFKFKQNQDVIDPFVM